MIKFSYTDIRPIKGFCVGSTEKSEVLIGPLRNFFSLTKENIFQKQTFAPAFTENFHVIAPDWRGHGDSQHADPPAYSTRHYIDDLHKLLVKTSC